MKFLICFILLFILSACAMNITSGGGEITTKQLMSLKPGVTTLDELKLIWGDPQTEMTGADGKTHASWHYSTTTLNSFGGDGRNVSRSANLEFDENGKLIDDSINFRQGGYKMK
ncbi:MAG: hypothetical protein HN548_05615 [Opitutae bacterium]|nr:hypothetical protein [Opitutae bacterium]